MDRRIQRTRQMIVEAFLALLEQKDFSDIIIKDITEKANVNRSTFYLHYLDKFDLLEKITAEHITALSEVLHHDKITYYEYYPSHDVPDPYFIALFEHIAKNEFFYKMMITKMPRLSFSTKLQELIRDSCYVRISHISLEKKLIVPLDLLLDYLSCSLIGIIYKWLDQQMMYAPRYMALQLTRLSLSGTYEAMGLTSQNP
ncbi:TetR/AcrR family transcriptional regulator [Paenibacillus periandrae]|uniref:TetR/AcrR family transcriptional regulator n=1 Tax=Paenibacillus periandrae TaxID=1761741 RepID=UPI001F092A15|nr:TetR/AcrR family transcriptional regulator [Paenibacillus periandrae]